MVFPQDPFGPDAFDKVFGTGARPPTPGPKKKEKGVPWEAKIINGVYYIPLSQVADLLRTNNVLPAVRRGVENRVSAQKLRHEQGL